MPENSSNVTVLAATPERKEVSASSGSLFKSGLTSHDALMYQLTTIPDPDETLKRVGIGRSELRRRLESDDEIYGALETRRDAAIATPWRLEPLKGTGEKDKEFIWQVLEPHIDDLLRGVWTALPVGYSVVDVTYARLDGNRIGLDHVSECPVDWFTPTPRGDLYFTGRSDQPLDTTFKYLLTRRNATYANPYGEALLSRLYWPWFFRSNAWRFWMQFLERFGDPMLLGKAKKPTDLSEALINLGLESHVIVNSDEEIKAVTTGLAGEFDKAESALVRRVQKIVLGQTLTSDVQGGGSFAAAKVHNEVREDRRNADLRMMTKTVQRLVNALWALNRFAGPPPEFVMADGEGLEPERAERDSTLVSSGAIELTEKYFLRTYDYEPGDFIIPARKTQGEPGGDDKSKAPELRSKPCVELSGRDRFTPRQEELEAVIESAFRSSADADPIDGSAILKAIKAARDPEDLELRLSMLLEEKSSQEFEDILSRALMAADVLGFVQEDAGKPASELSVSDAESKYYETLIDRLSGGSGEGRP